MGSQEGVHCFGWCVGCKVKQERLGMFVPQSVLLFFLFAAVGEHLGREALPVRPSVRPHTAVTTTTARTLDSCAFSTLPVSEGFELDGYAFISL